MSRAVWRRSARVADWEVEIGFVGLQTGPIAAFGASDDCILKNVHAAIGDGIEVAGEMHSVTIVVEDSQSNPNRAADVAPQLIPKGEVDPRCLPPTRPARRRPPGADRAPQDDGGRHRPERLPAARRSRCIHTMPKGSIAPGDRTTHGAILATVCPAFVLGNAWSSLRRACFSGRAGRSPEKGESLSSS
ncbi:MAG: hypothetical protein KDG89_02405 [Geminicoccaceae bacterium]|nr:hypothetical protein [Geminicoccaceae bacterium]